MRKCIFAHIPFVENNVSRVDKAMNYIFLSGSEFYAFDSALRWHLWADINNMVMYTVSLYFIQRRGIGLFFGLYQ